MAKVFAMCNIFTWVCMMIATIGNNLLYGHSLSPAEFSAFAIFFSLFGLGCSFTLVLGEPK